MVNYVSALTRYPYRSMYLNIGRGKFTEYLVTFDKEKPDVISEEAKNNRKTALTQLAPKLEFITNELKTEYINQGLGDLVSDLEVISTKDIARLSGKLEQLDGSNTRKKATEKNFSSLTLEKETRLSEGIPIPDRRAVLPSQTVNQNIELEEKISEEEWAEVDEIIRQREQEEAQAVDGTQFVAPTEINVTTEARGLPERVETARGTKEELEAELRAEQNIASGKFSNAPILTQDQEEKEEETGGFFSGFFSGPKVVPPKNTRKNPKVVSNDPIIIPKIANEVFPGVFSSTGGSVPAEPPVPPPIPPPVPPSGEPPVPPVNEEQPQPEPQADSVQNVPFAVDKVKSKSPKYHKYSINIFLGPVPEYDEDLSKAIYESGLNSKEIIMNIESVISTHGKELFIYERKSDTLEELNEVTQLQFCLLRNLQRGRRSKQALVPISSLANLYTNVNSQLNPNTTSEVSGVPPPGVEVKIPNSTLAEGAQESTGQESTGQVQLTPNDAFEAIVKAYRTRPFDSFGKPIINDSIVNMTRLKNYNTIKGPNTSKDLTNSFIENIPFKIAVKKNVC